MMANNKILNKKQKPNGFTLVMSLVLLLVMSLMGGSLIVIASGDHQSNNTSDEYQQTFYVAEHALLEGEKYIINKMRGEFKDTGGNAPSEGDGPFTGFEQGGEEGGDEEGGESLVKDPEGERDVSTRVTPKNIVDPQNTPCFNSFKNLTNNKVANHEFNLNFGGLLTNIILQGEDPTKEQSYMNRYRFEFFSVNAGVRIFKGEGFSVKKGSTGQEGRRGTVFKIYGCGYFMPKNAGDNEYDNPEILIPLETIIVVSS